MFCVSALVFNDFLKNEPKTSGFHTPADTGIPAFQRWLIETTLPTRYRNALSYLEEIISLELSMKPWVEDSAVEIRLDICQKGHMENLFLSHVATLKEVCLHHFAVRSHVFINDRTCTNFVIAPFKTLKKLLIQAYSGTRERSKARPLKTANRSCEAGRRSQCIGRRIALSITTMATGSRLRMSYITGTTICKC